jgi:hypothetical protein
MNEIKKEQEDIHATIIKPKEGKENLNLLILLQECLLK